MQCLSGFELYSRWVPLMIYTQGLGDQFAKALGRGQKKSEKRSRALPLQGSCFDLYWIVLLLISSFIIQPIILAFH